MANHTSLLVILIVIASLFVFYTAYDKQAKTILPGNLFNVLSFANPGHSLKELNKVAALAAIGLLSIAFLLGPLSKVFPSLFLGFLHTRKDIGLAGFALGFLHGAYSFMEYYGSSIEKTIYSNPNALGAITALLGLAIFFLMAITSTQQAMRKLGYPLWKALQTSGYIGLFLVALHFVLLELKPGKGFDVRPFGVLFIFIAVAAISLKVLGIFIKVHPHKAEDSAIFGHHEELAKKE